MKKINPKEKLNAKITRELKSKEVKFFMPDKNLSIDAEYLSLPFDITEIPSQELGKYLNSFTQQKMYIRTLLGFQENLVEEAKIDFFEVSKDKYKELSNGKLSESAKERIISMEGIIKDYNLTLKESIRKVELIKYNILNIEDAIFLVSREISRRGKDFSDENRNFNIEEH